MSRPTPNPQFDRGCQLTGRAAPDDDENWDGTDFGPSPGEWQADDFDLEEADPQPGDFWLEPDEVDDSAATHSRRAHQENDACWR